MQNTNIVTLTIEDYPDSENPCNQNGWALYRFGACYISGFDVFKYLNVPKTNFSCLSNIKRHGVGLAYFITLAGDDYIITDTLDGKCDGVLIWEKPAKNLVSKTKRDRRIDADCFLQQYNDWLNGRVYWYSLESQEYNVSCGGFFDYDKDPMFDNIKKELRTYAKANGYTQIKTVEFESDIPTSTESQKEVETLYLVFKHNCLKISIEESI